MMNKICDSHLNELRLQLPVSAHFVCRKFVNSGKKYICELSSAARGVNAVPRPYYFIISVKMHGNFFICILKCITALQAMRTGLHMSARLRAKPQLRLHQLWHLRLGFFVCFPPHDSGLLGESLPIGKCVYNNVISVKCTIVADETKSPYKISLSYITPSIGFSFGKTLIGLEDSWY